MPIPAFLFSLLGTFLFLQFTGAQSTSPSFDVASIKANNSAETATTLGFQPGGRFRAVNETLARLIGEGYATSSAVPRFRIVGGPGWIDSDRFDVDARPGQEVKEMEARAMLRQLSRIDFVSPSVKKPANSRSTT